MFQKQLNAAKRVCLLLWRFFAACQRSVSFFFTVLCIGHTPDTAACVAVIMDVDGDVSSETERCGRGLQALMSEVSTNKQPYYTHTHTHTHEDAISVPFSPGPSIPRNH